MLSVCSGKPFYLLLSLFSHINRFSSVCILELSLLESFKAKSKNRKREQRESGLSAAEWSLELLEGVCFLRILVLLVFSCRSCRHFLV